MLSAETVTGNPRSVCRATPAHLFDELLHQLDNQRLDDARATLRRLRVAGFVVQQPEHVGGLRLIQVDSLHPLS